MKLPIGLIFLFSLAGCASVNRPAPLISGCINWMPLNLDDHGGRQDATPHSVLISVDANLQSQLLELTPEPVAYKSYCWYRDVASGGILLYPQWNSDADSYRFELLDGNWVFKAQYEILTTD